MMGRDVPRKLTAGARDGSEALGNLAKGVFLGGGGRNSWDESTRGRNLPS